jgi:hypothetical protein
MKDQLPWVGCMDITIERLPVKHPQRGVRPFLVSHFPESTKVSFPFIQKDLRSHLFTNCSKTNGVKCSITMEVGLHRKFFGCIYWVLVQHHTPTDNAPDTTAQ